MNHHRTYTLVCLDMPRDEWVLTLYYRRQAVRTLHGSWDLLSRKAAEWLQNSQP